MASVKDTTQGPRGIMRPKDDRASLLVYHRDGAEIVSLRPGEPMSIGREPPARVRVQDPSLSREHARFLLTDGKVTVEDLGSTNGTWIGKRRLARGEPREVRGCSCTCSRL